MQHSYLETDLTKSHTDVHEKAESLSIIQKFCWCATVLSVLASRWDSWNKDTNLRKYPLIYFLHSFEEDIPRVHSEVVCGMYMYTLTWNLKSWIICTSSITCPLPKTHEQTSQWQAKLSQKWQHSQRCRFLCGFQIPVLTQTLFHPTQQSQHCLLSSSALHINSLITCATKLLWTTTPKQAFSLEQKGKNKTKQKPPTKNPH